MIRIGISGWRHEPWRGMWYPEGLRSAASWSSAAGIFPTVEINGSFYSLQRPQYYADWCRGTPPGFVFAVKGSRYITHLLLRPARHGRKSRVGRPATIRNS